MNQHEEILKERSKKHAEKITDYIGNSMVKQLARQLRTGDVTTAQRTAWIVSSCAGRYLHLILPHLTEFIDIAKNPPHVAVKRNILRVMTFVTIPEKVEGKAYDLATRLASQSKEDVAVRCHALTILATLAMKYPELKTEVCEIITSMRNHDSPGVRSRNKKMTDLLKCRNRLTQIRN